MPRAPARSAPASACSAARAGAPPTKAPPPTGCPASPPEVGQAFDLYRLVTILGRALTDPVHAATLPGVPSTAPGASCATLARPAAIRASPANCFFDGTSAHRPRPSISIPSARISSTSRHRRPSSRGGSNASPSANRYACSPTRCRSKAAVLEESRPHDGHHALGRAGLSNRSHAVTAAWPTDPHQSPTPSPRPESAPAASRSPTGRRLACRAHAPTIPNPQDEIPAKAGFPASAAAAARHPAYAATPTPAAPRTPPAPTRPSRSHAPAATTAPPAPPASAPRRRARTRSRRYHRTPVTSRR